jgi:hypothetical protein
MNTVIQQQQQQSPAARLATSVLPLNQCLAATGCVTFAACGATGPGAGGAAEDVRSAVARAPAGCAVDDESAATARWRLAAQQPLIGQWLAVQWTAYVTSTLAQWRRSRWRGSRPCLSSRWQRDRQRVCRRSASAWQPQAAWHSKEAPRPDQAQAAR